MSAIHTERRQPDARLATLARKDILRYLRHPAFLIGAALTVASCLFRPDEQFSSALQVIAPAAGLGLFGMIVMASLTRSSDAAAAAAGTVSTSQRTRTLALGCALVVPFAAGLVWFAWAVWAYNHWPAAPQGAPFGDISDTYMYATMFDLGVLAAVGGPVVGLVIGRWLPRRGAAPIAVVVMVLVTIVMQGIFEPLRYLRLVAPWTYFVGPFGTDGDGDRTLALTGSPYWYGAYLVALCTFGVLFAMLRDEEHSRHGLKRALAVVGLVAVVFCTLAITGGPQEVLVNPLPSGR
ncbi:MAG TPA: hypothetical protein VEX15_05305 [Nocardioidaceae bacterium]|nr:hypothetical protein [Nocardioidaceae bacterium]